MCRFQRTYSTLDLLDKECSTWQLIRSLFKDRLEMEEEAAPIEEEEEADGDEAKKPKRLVKASTGLSRLAGGCRIRP